MAVSLPNISLLYLAGAALLSASLWYAYRVLTSPISQLPGPWHSKWTNVAVKYQWLAGRRAFYVHQLHQEFGPAVRLGPTEVDFSDIDAVKTIYSVKTEFPKSTWYQRMVPYESASVFSTSDIEFHRRHRRLLSAPLSVSSLKLIEPILHRRTVQAMDKMADEIKSRGVTDVFKWALFYSTDVVGELTFGESFRMLDMGKVNQYILNLQSNAKLNGLRSTFPSLVTAGKYVPLPLFRRAAQATRQMRSYAQQSMQRYRRLISADPSTRPTLFSRLFKAGEHGLSDEEIIADAQAYIIAGSDTTAVSFTYLVWAVCRRDEVKKTLLQELATLPHDFSMEHLNDLSYLNQVIDEALRVYGALPAALPRIVPTGGANLAGYWIPGGTTVTAQAYTMHRNPSVYPRPETFDPSRWATTTKAMKDSFMPFGLGSRICLGIHLARMELRLATALFFLRFPNAKISAREGMTDDDMSEVIYFLLGPKGRRCLVEPEQEQEGY